MKLACLLSYLLITVNSSAQFELETHLEEIPDHFNIFYAENAAKGSQSDFDLDPGVVKIRKMNDGSSPFDCINDTISYLMNLYYKQHYYYRFTVQCGSSQCISGIEEKLLNRTSKLKWGRSADSVLVTTRPFKIIRLEGKKYVVLLMVYTTSNLFSIDSMRISKAEWKVLRKKLSQTTIYPEDKLQ